MLFFKTRQIENVNVKFVCIAHLRQFTATIKTIKSEILTNRKQRKRISVENTRHKQGLTTVSVKMRSRGNYAKKDRHKNKSSY